ncbi:MAG: O-antigen ligase family protein [Verrucomicrobia bacterium]|nr:MAG: O-antigen ligase family protein [Verrucomicrobiota bacterium]
MNTPDSRARGTVPAWAAALLGAFLGLALLKFGNPVILDAQVSAPGSWNDLLSESWPPRWGFPLFACVAVAIAAFSPLAALLLRTHPGRVPAALAMAWLGWQFVAAQRSVDPTLTRLTLPHFAVLVACYVLGWLVVSRSRNRMAIFAGLGVAAIVCWLRAVNQHAFEFPQDHAMLVEGQQVGWTNFPPAAVDEMRHSEMILRTNGVDIANPAILDKLRRGRSFGTLVYPNALAGCVLLLLPPVMAIGFVLSRQLRPNLGRLLLLLVVLLGGLSLYWSGSKSGWLIGLSAGAIALFRLAAIQRYRVAIVALLVVAGLVIFGARFSGYFSRGATSISARMDYWRAALQTSRDHPLAGTGPGTFQRPYARLKHPDAEMARLVHNDYLEQFSDSGLPGGILYLAWIGSAAILVWRRPPTHPVWAATGLGVGAWLVQGFSEFSLYVPGLAWAAFALLGMLVAGEAPEEMTSTPGVVADKNSRSK